MVWMSCEANSTDSGRGVVEVDGSVAACEDSF